jgi:hypothetical protein
MAVSPSAQRPKRITLGGIAPPEILPECNFSYFTTIFTGRVQMMVLPWLSAQVVE